MLRAPLSAAHVSGDILAEFLDVSRDGIVQPDSMDQLRMHLTDSDKTNGEKLFELLDECNKKKIISHWWTEESEANLAAERKDFMDFVKRNSPDFHKSYKIRLGKCYALYKSWQKFDMEEKKLSIRILYLVLEIYGKCHNTIYRYSPIKPAVIQKKQPKVACIDGAVAELMEYDLEKELSSYIAHTQGIIKGAVAASSTRNKLRATLHEAEKDVPPTEEEPVPEVEEVPKSNQEDHIAPSPTMGVDLFCEEGEEEERCNEASPSQGYEESQEIFGSPGSPLNSDTCTEDDFPSQGSRTSTSSQPTEGGKKTAKRIRRPMCETVPTIGAEPLISFDDINLSNLERDRNAMANAMFKLNDSYLAIHSVIENELIRETSPKKYMTRQELLTWINPILQQESYVTIPSVTSYQFGRFLVVLSNIHNVVVRGDYSKVMVSVGGGATNQGIQKKSLLSLTRDIARSAKSLIKEKELNAELKRQLLASQSEKQILESELERLRSFSRPEKKRKTNR